MAGIVAATLGTLLAPLVQRLAERFHLVDKPDGHHKRHGKPTPLGGGLLIFIATVAGVASVASLSSIVGELLWSEASLVTGFLYAAAILMVVGSIDDMRPMRGRYKLVGQTVAALVLTGYGLEIRQLEFLGWSFDLGVMAVPFTVFWLLGAINSLNLLDGIDGLAGTIGFITSLLVACISVSSGQPFAALIAVALAGGCLAFLHVNLPPAKMFLGDTGSMFLGLMLGGLAVVCCSNGPGLLSIAPAIALLSLPILDSSFALLRRRLTGRSIYMTDRGHLHHCLMQSLESHHAVLVIVAMACLAAGLGAYLSVYMKNDVTAVVSTGLVVFTLVILRLFGFVECSLLLKKLFVRATRFFRKPATLRDRGHATNVTVRLQGEREWNLLWASLVEWADKLNLSRLELDVNLPAMKEGFHANWLQPSHHEWHEMWKMDLPLFVEGHTVGRLQICGERRDQHSSVCDTVDQLIELLGPFEQAFRDLAVPAQSSKQQGESSLQVGASEYSGRGPGLPATKHERNGAVDDSSDRLAPPVNPQIATVSS